jgi:hypothetical protein
LNDKEFTNFVDNNKVSKRILRSIAINIIEGRTLTTREVAIYQEKGEQIENIIKNGKRRS